MSPLTPKGRKIKAAMVKTYGARKGERVFYASERAERITGVVKKRQHRKAKKRGS